MVAISYVTAAMALTAAVVTSSPLGIRISPLANPSSSVLTAVSPPNSRPQQSPLNPQGLGRRRRACSSDCHYPVACCMNMGGLWYCGMCDKREPGSVPGLVDDERGDGGENEGDEEKDEKKDEDGGEWWW